MVPGRRTPASWTRYPTTASMAMRPCLISTYRRRSNFSWSPSATSPKGSDNKRDKMTVEETHSTCSNGRSSTTLSRTKKAKRRLGSQFVFERHVQGSGSRLLGDGGKGGSAGNKESKDSRLHGGTWQCVDFVMWQWKNWIRFPPRCGNVLQLWYKNSVDFYAKIPSF
jgi:hypothetical protein